MNEDRPIEKLLRRFAAKRRDDAGAPMELHPANRRMLETEVTRQFGSHAKSGGGLAWLGLLLRGRLAYALALLGVAVVAALFVFPNKGSDHGEKFAAAKKVPEPAMVVAVNSPVAASAPAAESDAMKLTDPRSRPLFNDNLGLDKKSLSLRDGGTAASGDLDVNRKSEPAELLTLGGGGGMATGRMESDTRQQRVAESIARYYEQKKDADSTRLDSPIAKLGAQTREAQPAAANHALVPAPSVHLPAVKSKAVTDAATTGSAIGKPQPVVAFQNFSRAPVSAAAREAVAPVLVNFLVEQNGDRVRVTDGDGSIYDGALGESENESGSKKEILARGGGQEKLNYRAVSGSVAPGQAGADQAQNPSLKLIGTNRTLNQPVQFSGNIVWFSNRNFNAAEAQWNDRSKAANQPQALQLWQNSSIQGRLKVGDGREIEFNAVPAKP